MSEYRETQGRDGPVPEKWHLSKQVQLSHVFSTAAAITAVVVFGAGIERRVALLEQADLNFAVTKQAEKEQTARDREGNARDRMEILHRLEGLTEKLDKLLEGRRR